MSGFYTPGLETVNAVDLTGDERIPMDMLQTQGVAPETAAITLDQIALWAPPTDALTFASTTNTDLSAGGVFSFTATSNFTLANPTNPVDGKSYRWIITQDGTGSRIITYGSKFLLSGTSTLSTAAGSVDMLTATYNATLDKYLASLQKAFA